MIIVTGSIPTFKIRTAQTASYNNFRVKLDLTNEDTLTYSVITNVTASYDTNGYLNIRASASLDYNSPYSITILQYTGSLTNQLYLGEIMRTTASSTVFDAEPFISYTGSASTNDYIIF
jgi:hypothetical protein